MEIVRTYRQDGENMVHDGYFLLVQGIPLKWISLDDFNNLENAYKH